MRFPLRDQKKRQRGLQGIGRDQVGERSDRLGSSAGMDERGRHLKQTQANVRRVAGLAGPRPVALNKSPPAR